MMYVSNVLKMSFSFAQYIGRTQYFMNVKKTNYKA